MDTVFARGFAAHRDGRLTDAECDYQAALAAEPLHIDALHYLASACCAVNKASTRRRPNSCAAPSTCARPTPVCN